MQKKIGYQFFLALAGIRISLGKVLKLHERRPFPIPIESESLGVEFHFEKSPLYS